MVCGAVWANEGLGNLQALSPAPARSVVPPSLKLAGAATQPGGGRAGRSGRGCGGRAAEVAARSRGACLRSPALQGCSPSGGQLLAARAAPHGGLAHGQLRGDCGAAGPGAASTRGQGALQSDEVHHGGVKLGLQSIPIATACTIYHKFFGETDLDAYDPYLIAMSAIYLAGKVEEQHLRTRDIINVSTRYLNPSSEPLELDGRFWELRDSIVHCELLVLRVLRFQVSFQHPHKYLLHYLISLKNWMNRYSWQRTPISVTAWALLRDSYHGGLCLRFRAQHIAVAVLHLALQLYGVEVPAEAEAEKPWWQVFSDDLTKPTIDNIVSDLIQIYTMDTEIP